MSDSNIPQGLKPSIFENFSGTTKVVPFQEIIYETGCDLSLIHWPLTTVHCSLFL
jgi:hypothetical protein